MELENLEVKASGELDPAKFQAEETSERAGFKSISMDISVRSDADEATLRELFKRVEDPCPVRDNISHRTPVNFMIS